MRKMIAVLLVFSSMLTGTVSKADDVDSFVNGLNAAWVTTNYATCLSNINNRLSTSTNDLPALVAKSCYFVFVDADYPAATNIFQTTDSLVSGLSGTNVTIITTLYEGLRDDIKACLSVPMTNAPPDVQKQYVRDALYPTNYPEQRLLRLLGNP
jgi:hypothetical protein